MSQAIMNLQKASTNSSVYQNSVCMIRDALTSLPEGTVKTVFVKQLNAMKLEEEQVLTLYSQLRNINSCPVRTAIAGRTGMVAVSLFSFLSLPVGAIATASYFCADIGATAHKIELKNRNLCQDICCELIDIGWNRTVWLAQADQLIREEINNLTEENRKIENKDRKKYEIVSPQVNPSANNPRWIQNINKIERLIEFQNTIAIIHKSYSKLLKDWKSSQMKWTIGPFSFDVNYDNIKDKFIISSQST